MCLRRQKRATRSWKQHLLAFPQESSLGRRGHILEKLTQDTQQVHFRHSSPEGVHLCPEQRAQPTPPGEQNVA